MPTALGDVVHARALVAALREEARGDVEDLFLAGLGRLDGIHGFSGSPGGSPRSEAGAVDGDLRDGGPPSGCWRSGLSISATRCVEALLLGAREQATLRGTARSPRTRRAAARAMRRGRPRRWPASTRCARRARGGASRPATGPAPSQQRHEDARARRRTVPPPPRKSPPLPTTSQSRWISTSAPVECLHDGRRALRTRRHHARRSPAVASWNTARVTSNSSCPMRRPISAMLRRPSHCVEHLDELRRRPPARRRRHERGNPRRRSGSSPGRSAARPCAARPPSAAAPC